MNYSFIIIPLSGEPFLATVSAETMDLAFQAVHYQYSDAVRVKEVTSNTTDEVEAMMEDLKAGVFESIPQL
jgi:hypothetical protein